MFERSAFASPVSKRHNVRELIRCAGAKPVPDSASVDNLVRVISTFNYLIETNRWGAHRPRECNRRRHLLRGLFICRLFGCYFFDDFFNALVGICVNFLEPPELFDVAEGVSSSTSEATSS